PTGVSWVVQGRSSHTSFLAARSPHPRGPAAAFSGGQWARFPRGGRKRAQTLFVQRVTVRLSKPVALVLALVAEPLVPPVVLVPGWQWWRVGGVYRWLSPWLLPWSQALLVWPSRWPLCQQCPRPPR